MATQNPQIQNGTYVQLNPVSDSPRAAPPSAEEQTIGIVRQAFTKGDGNYYQVVWNPGAMNPKEALYHESELTTLSQQQANQIINQIASGTYTPSTPQQGSQYTQPNIPTSALPPGLQGWPGSFSATNPGTSNTPPSLQQTS